MELINEALTNLVPYKNNPRINDGAVAGVRASIEQCGYIAPIIVDEERTILAGHTRFKALQQMGRTHAEIIVMEGLTEPQKKKFRILDNKTNEVAEWDLEKLAEEIADLDFGEFDFNIPDFCDPDDIDGISDDKAPEPATDKPTRSQLGDVWQLGEHRLIVGDCTDPQVIGRLMNGRTADLLLTDPPYNVGYVGKTAEQLKIVNDSMSADLFRTFLTDAFRTAAAVLKPGGTFYIWHAHSKGHIVTAAAEEALGEIRQALIWNKNVIALGRQDYQWKHEACLYGWKEGAAHYFTNDRTQSTVIPETTPEQIKKMNKTQLVDLVMQYRQATEEMHTTVIDCKKPSRNAEHPTMKPVPLIAKQIVNSSERGQIILDPFGGSGSTMIAAEHLGRACYTAELDPVYADVILTRWETITGRPAEKL